MTECERRSQAEALAKGGRPAEACALLERWLRDEPEWWLGWVWWLLLTQRHSEDRLAQALWQAEANADAHAANISQSENIYDFVAALWFKDGQREEGERVAAKAAAVRGRERRMRAEAAEQSPWRHDACTDGFFELEYLLLDERKEDGDGE